MRQPDRVQIVFSDSIYLHASYMEYRVSVLLMLYFAIRLAIRSTVVFTMVVRHKREVRLVIKAADGRLWPLVPGLAWAGSDF